MYSVYPKSQIQVCFLRNINFSSMFFLQKALSCNAKKERRLPESNKICQKQPLFIFSVIEEWLWFFTNSERFWSEAKQFGTSYGKFSFTKYQQFQELIRFCCFKIVASLWISPKLITIKLWVLITWEIDFQV